MGRKAAGETMLIKTLPLGQLETNCYIVTDPETLDCVVIDPGDESNVILSYLEENHLKPQAIFLTHGHHDHFLAAEAVALETGVKIYINRRDTEADGPPQTYRFRITPETVFYAEGDEIQAGGLTFHVMETPGHSPGSVTLRCGDALFTGDCLFRDSCGRADLPGGDMETIMESLRRLGSLDGDFEVYPGHMDSSSLERERRFNYYLRYAMGQEA